MFYTAKVVKVDHFFYAGDEYTHCVDRFTGEEEVFAGM